MAKIKGQKKKLTPVYKLSTSILNKLPASERPSASATLWNKSASKCALCSLPLDLETKDSVVADHQVPEAKSGQTKLSNLYLAHRTCNASRQHLDFSLAQPLIQFRSFTEQQNIVDFDTVIDRYLPNKNRQLIKYLETSPGVAEVSFGHQKVAVPLAVDPATKIKYFFLDVPMEYIQNDKDIQPRTILPGHVRKLAIDFDQRPVHEPSNCRLVITTNNYAKLLQFDGQHKTTAQILLGRKTAPIKIYVNPDIDMLQTLVIKIQQEIKKQPLTKSETLAKIGDVVERYLDNYNVKGARYRSEKGFIASQVKGDELIVKKLYFDQLRKIIFFHDENLLSKAVGPGVSKRPTTVAADRMLTQL